MPFRTRQERNSCADTEDPALWGAKQVIKRILKLPFGQWTFARAGACIASSAKWQQLAGVSDDQFESEVHPAATKADDQASSGQRPRRFPNRVRIATGRSNAPSSVQRSTLSANGARAGVGPPQLGGGLWQSATPPPKIFRAAVRRTALRGRRRQLRCLNSALP